VTSTLSDDGRTRTYTVVGQVFFASSDKFVDAFDFKEAVDKVVIDLCQAHFWDLTSVGALDKVVLKFATIVDRFAVHDKPGAVDNLMAH